MGRYSGHMEHNEAVQTPAVGASTVTIATIVAAAEMLNVTPDALAIFLLGQIS